MNAIELRIGNLIGMTLEIDPQNFFLVLEVADEAMKTSPVGMHFNSGDSLRDINYHNAEHFEAIPFTEEWLKRAGYELIKESHHKFIDKTDLVKGGPLERLDRLYRIPGEDKEYACIDVSVILDPVTLEIRRIGFEHITKGQGLTGIGSVHQFQNGFYTLYGEDVIFKPI